MGKTGLLWTFLFLFTFYLCMFESTESGAVGLLLEQWVGKGPQESALVFHPSVSPDTC